MKRVELYSIEEINKYLTGLQYIRLSHLISPKGIFPIGDGKVRVENAAFFDKESYKIGIPGFKEGFQKTRKRLREFMPGCDLYFEISDVPETAQMRHDLSQGKVTIEVDEKGQGIITEKKYFFLRDVPAPMRRKMKGIDLSDTCWVIENENDYSIVFDKPNEQDGLFAKQGSLITVTDIKKIEELGFASFLLNDNHFDTFVQNGTTITKTTLEQNLDTTVVYNDKDDIPYKPDGLPKERIVTFYEYDPATERPTFGEACELNNIGTDANGEIIWCKTPKIIQNEHNAEYASRADHKKVRTVIELKDSEIDTIIPMLREQGKMNQVVEFSIITEMGSDFLIEKKNYIKESQSSFRL